MWSLEESLIINCLSNAPKNQLSKLVQNSRINWDSFIRQSSRHGVSGLIYSYSRKGNFDNIFPPHVTASLEKQYYTNLTRNMVYLKEIKKILSACNNVGTILFTQGAGLLLSQIYPSLGMRPLTDIDLIVDPNKRADIIQVLQEAGYTPLPHYPSLLSRNGIVLDIHTDIANMERISARKYALKISNNSLWQTAQLQKGSWGGAYTLSAEDLIITAAAHLQKHSYSRFIWFVDIINIIESSKEKLDWHKIIARTKEFNTQQSLFFTLTFIEKVFNYNFPVTLSNALLDRKLNLIEEKFLNGLLNGNKQEQLGDVLYLFSIKAIHEKMLFIKENIFPKREVMTQVFGTSNPLLLSFCYPLRFFQSLLYGFKLLIPAPRSLNTKVEIRQ